MNDPYVKNGLAIVNPYGGIWTNEIFDTPEAAVQYLKSFWKNVSSFDLSEWKLAMATQTVTLYRAKADPVFIEMPTEALALAVNDARTMEGE